MNTDYAGDPTTPAAVNVQGDRIQSPTPDGPPAAAEETAAPEDEAEGPGTGAYEDRTMDQLRVVARGRGLPTSGTKDELIDRLRG
jgi:hypothetical protein